MLSFYMLTSQIIGNDAIRILNIRFNRLRDNHSPETLEEHHKIKTSLYTTKNLFNLCNKSL